MHVNIVRFFLALLCMKSVLNFEATLDADV